MNVKIQYCVVDDLKIRYSNGREREYITKNLANNNSWK